MTETIRFGNVHSRADGIDLLVKGKPLAAGASEAQLPAYVKRVPGYRSFFGGEGHPSDRWADTVVMRRQRGTVHHGCQGLLLSRAVEPERVSGLPRFASAALFGCSLGPLAVVSLHLHWIGPAADNPEEPRVEETDEGMHKLIAYLRFLGNVGYQVVVGGDLNVPEEERTPGWMDPWEAFDMLGYKTVDRWRLDGAALSPGLRLASATTLQGLHDHPGIELEVGRT